MGEGFAIVTPGIRPAGAETNDQQRIATPAQAISNGVSHIVVGRPITHAPDPAKAAQAIISEMEQAKNNKKLRSRLTIASLVRYSHAWRNLFFDAGVGPLCFSAN
jgi:hypothetical protein